MPFKATIVAYALSMKCFKNGTIRAYACLRVKPAIYNIEKHVKHTLILKVNYAYCVHITDFGLNTYQRIEALFIHKNESL